MIRIKLIICSIIFSVLFGLSEKSMASAQAFALEEQLQHALRLSEAEEAFQKEVCAAAKSSLDSRHKRQAIKMLQNPADYTVMVWGCGHNESEAKHTHFGCATVNIDNTYSPDYNLDVTDKAQTKTFEDNSANLIYLEYITKGPLSNPNTFDEVYRILRPGGELWFDYYYAISHEPGRPRIFEFSCVPGVPPHRTNRKELKSRSLTLLASRLKSLGFKIPTVEINLIRGKNPFNDRDDSREDPQYLIRVIKPKT